MIRHYHPFLHHTHLIIPILPVLILSVNIIIIILPGNILSILFPSPFSPTSSPSTFRSSLRGHSLGIFLLGRYDRLSRLTEHLDKLWVMPLELWSPRDGSNFGSNDGSNEETKGGSNDDLNNKSNDWPKTMGKSMGQIMNETMHRTINQMMGRVTGITSYGGRSEGLSNMVGEVMD